MTKKEMAQKLRGRDLLALSAIELGSALRLMERTGNGEKEELVERLYKEIWRPVYDTEEEINGSV